MSNASISPISSRAEQEPTQLERIEQQVQAQKKSAEARHTAAAERLETDRAEISPVAAAPENVPSIGSQEEANSLLASIQAKFQSDASSAPFLHSNLTANSLAGLLNQD